MKLVNQDARSVVRADQQCYRTMRIDVIRSILRVVFNHGDAGVFPVRTVRHCLDQQSKCIVVISNVELWRRLARADAVGVIVRETQDREVRQSIASSRRTLDNKCAKLVQPRSDARVATKSRLSVSIADERIRLSLFCRAIRIDSHRVRRAQVEVAILRVESPFQ